MRADYIKDRKAAWGFGNTVLYRMCLSDAKFHTDEDEIAGKLWLIGRSYAASPERGAGEAAPGQDPDFFKFLATSPQWPRIDEALVGLSDERPFSSTTLPAVLKAHAMLVELIREMSKMRLSGDKKPRGHTSFASKYLHFHRPDHFPIFDSYVNEAISREYPRVRHSPPAEVDPRYSRFCSMVLQLLCEQADLETLRALDQRLYEKQRAHKVAKISARN